MLEAYIETIHDLQAERDAAITERARYGDMMTARLGQCENERDAAREELAIARKVMDKVADQRDAARAEVAALRAALQSLVDGKSEFDIEYDTGMPADEARRIMDLAYNRK
jgi:uncharacterized coiled-coil DUF342 family protein